MKPRPILLASLVALALTGALAACRRGEPVIAPVPLVSLPAVSAAASDGPNPGSKPDKPKPPPSVTVRFAVGDEVDVEWREVWYAASVLEVVGDKYKIHYDGYGDEWNEVVPPARIRPRSGQND
jgi:hypothetical protein